MPLEFAPFPIGMYADKTQEVCASMSEALERYYAKKNRHTVMHQKSSDLRRHISTLLERTSKKLQLQLRQQEDTAKREKYRLYGELLHTYGYQIPAGAKNAQVTNYYDGSEITIPLDDTLSAMDTRKNISTATASSNGPTRRFRHRYGRQRNLWPISSPSRVP